MITVILWHWGDLYTKEHVNLLHRALKRHLHVPFETVCICDDYRGFDPTITLIPLRHVYGKRHCRRLWVFSKDMCDLGSTLLQIDIDTIITGDITPLVESFVANNCTFQVWKCKMSSRYRFGLNPTFMMLQAGAHSDIWDGYRADPEHRIMLANRAGWPASDQAIISHHFTNIVDLTHAEPTCPVWTHDDGIISLRDELMHVYQAPHLHAHDPLPPNTRLVSFHGRFDPKQFTMLDWVKEHWLGESIPV